MSYSVKFTRPSILFPVLRDIFRVELGYSRALVKFRVKDGQDETDPLLYLDCTPTTKALQPNGLPYFLTYVSTFSLFT